MAIPHSKTAFFSLEDIGGSARDLSAYLTDISPAFSVDVAETTGLTAAHKTRVAGQADTKISLSGRYDTTADSGTAEVLGEIWAAGGVKTNGTAPTWIYGPRGSTGTYEKYTGTAIMTGYNPSAKLGEAVGFTATFEAASATSRTTF